MRVSNTSNKTNGTAGSALKNRKRRIALIVAAIVLLIGFTFLVATTNKPPKNVHHETPESGKQTESELSNYKYQVTVTIAKNNVTPQTLRIPRDSKIVWLNKDSLAHRIAIVPGTYEPPEFDKNHLIVVGDGYPYVIHQAATFHYFLVDNPKASATVIVK